MKTNKMKRKATGTLLFNWKRVAGSDDDDNDDNHYCTTNLKVLLWKSPHYTNSVTLPYELLLKIFKYLVNSSEDPLKELCSLARVCECWRGIVLQSPCLWNRIDLTRTPATDINLKILSNVFNQNHSILENVHEIAFQKTVEFKDDKVEKLLMAPNMKTLIFRDMNKFKTNRMTSVLSRTLKHCKLRCLTISNSRVMLGNQKWLADYLMENGQQLENLNLAMSLNSISTQLFRSIGKNYCPNLRILDLSTCDTVNTHSFDAVQLIENVPNLTVLRVANISFKRVFSRPDKSGLSKLEELSMPIAIRDPDRDDALFSTLTFSSDLITTLDLRGSSISATALLELPSYNLKELHMDDMCPIQRRLYPTVIEKWRSSLKVLSLVKINCSETIKKCLEVLYNTESDQIIRELDLTSSDVTVFDLKYFLKSAKSLRSIDLTSCRSLPRGCKNRYAKGLPDSTSLQLTKLVSTLEKIKD